MAEPSSKARKASTPHSSPPNQISYAFREDSYYTDDQSDSCYGGDYGASTSFIGNVQRESDNQSESYDSHESHCTLHADTLATHCNALTQRGRKCSRKAKVFIAGYYPVCALHSRYLQGMEAGRCQAVEECGRICDRFAPHAPPYHLCAKHEKGTDTLPCGIMSLPTELHLMIIRYLFPKAVPCYGLTRHAGAVLQVNRALNQAASTIIYDELEFEVSISQCAICCLGRTWRTDEINPEYSNINAALCQVGAQRLRKLNVDVEFAAGHTRIKGIGTHGISVEDFELYQVRDNVRKFVDVLWPMADSLALKQLKVRPAPDVRFNWQTDEIVAAVFFVLEPFIALGPIEAPALLPCSKPSIWHIQHRPVTANICNLHKDETYRRLRKSWVKSMKARLLSPNNVRREGKWETLITREYNRIEELLALIQKKELATSTKHGWMSHSFQGIERVLHIARVVDMNINHDGSDDLDRMHQIREAIMKRWVNAHRQQQSSLSAIAACINSMFHSSSEDLSRIYPDAFEFETLDLIEQDDTIDYLWSELGNPDVVPKLGESGVAYTEDDFRIYIHKEDKTYVRLKTPAVVRQLRILNRT